tara:strand:- start:321 stop:506 length:186 start_codon:yes stop_codon:yes gene_type:complete
MSNEMGQMINLDDIKVAFASVGGLGHWWILEIDMILKVAISVASLVYIVLKCKGLIDKKKD